MWRHFVWAFAITGAMLLAACVLVILLVDPLGVSPIGIVAKTSGYAVADRRFVAPQIISSGRHDSFLVGTSTIHHVDPAWADEAFGDHFATVAIHGGTPYEMSKMMALIGRKDPAARRVILGVDARRWCRAESYDRYNPKAVFPDWLYDNSRLDDFSALFNLSMLRYAFRQLEIAFGLIQPQFPLNGYSNSLVDAKWDLATAKKKLYRNASRNKDNATFGLDDADDALSGVGDEPAFPDLALFEQAIDGLQPATELIVAVMPSHITAVNKADHDGIERCKRRLASLVDRRHGYLIDFRIDSTWTRNDENFWDDNHFRVGLAHSLIFRVKEAVDRRRDAKDGIYRFLAGPAPANAEAAPANTDRAQSETSLHR
jgi:hypothetical protein